MSSRRQTVQNLPNGRMGAGKRPVLTQSQTVERLIGTTGNRSVMRQSGGKFKYEY